MQKSILGFFGPYRFLSNFHFVNVELDGEIYRTTEHAYQAAKTLDTEERRKIRDLLQPREARQAGQRLQLRPNWDKLKIDVMTELSIQKYAKPPLSAMLLETGDAYLEETNTWGDKFWGVCGGYGENNLGKILMQVRTELQAIQSEQAAEILKQRL